MVVLQHRAVIVAQGKVILQPEKDHSHGPAKCKWTVAVAGILAALRDDASSACISSFAWGFYPAQRRSREALQSAQHNLNRHKALSQVASSGSCW